MAKGDAFLCWSRCGSWDSEDDPWTWTAAWDSDGPEEAASAYAEYLYESRDGWESVSDGFEIAVKDKDGQVHSVDVAVDWDPIFHASPAPSPAPSPTPERGDT